MELKKDCLSVHFDEKSGAVTLYKCEKEIFSTLGADENYSFFNVRSDENGINFTLDNGEKFACRYEFCGGDTLKFLIEGDNNSKSVKYPPSFKYSENCCVYLPLCEGVAFYANEKVKMRKSNRVLMSGGSGLSMAFTAFSNSDGSWVLCAFITSDDGAVCTGFENGVFTCKPEWTPSLGKFSYKREIRFIWGSSGGVTALCKAYRKIAGELGYIVTLEEKAKKVKNLEKFIGSANFWVWNDDADKLLYSESDVYSVPGAEQRAQRLKVAEDMKKNGINKVLWSIFNESIDISEIEKMKQLGYLTVFYDIYTDVIPKPIFDKIPKPRQKRCEARMPYWPDSVAEKADGTYTEAWQLKGTDSKMYYQNRICDAEAVKIAEKIILPRRKKTGMDGTFIDGSACSPVECYNKNHITTCKESWEAKNRLMEVVTECDGICGTEIGCEKVARTIHYNEGMLSPIEYRAPDSGRRMMEIYDGDGDMCVLDDYMLNPKYRVPLWELVFHGCVQSFWYWGDSHLCAPNRAGLRDGFCALYGLSPIFSFKVGNWEMLKEKIINSYKATVDNATNVGFCEMTDFEYLTSDFAVQKTTFSNGTSVTVNFDINDRSVNGLFLKGGEIIIKKK